MQSHLGEIAAGLPHREILARSQREQIPDCNTLEAHRLLECNTDADIGTVGDVQPGNILAIQQDLSGSGGHDTGNELGEGGFTAAIGASDDHEFIIPDCEIDMLEDLLAVRQCITYIFEFQHAEHLLNRI